ncbi:hypothetical protein DSH65_15145 [Enterococcus faecalis]|uniref:Uncharacterized protein n=1 Tax=Enterococcus faecalis TaxID=1351 RepID=A0ABD7IYF4_ENTFL|nr:hypothetical protein [Enterococcus faecalis]EGO8469867.1 hypothetical protein [Enterococcus faecalis]EGO8482642.1 hypothetical protein [Enterococcus faecalis]EGO8541443.1 hypothetical protein [Enterococcus faecalis]EGO8643041.1 hypothetical protein [Enterococcus faecalis]
MKNDDNISNTLIVFFDKVVRLWSLFLFLIILIKVFFISNTAIISKNIFYVTGIISIISTLLLIWQEKRRAKL